MARSCVASLSHLLFSSYLLDLFLFVWCKDCSKPLGLQDGQVQNSQFSASSYYRHFTVGFNTVDLKPEFARLNNSLAWCGNGKSGRIFIQVDILRTVNISAIATQGFLGINVYYVKAYRILYSSDGVRWKSFGTNDSEKVWRGNSDANTVVTNKFTSTISARYVRVYPVSYNRHACLRIELYGCTNNTSGTTPRPTVTTLSVPVSTSYNTVTSLSVPSTVSQHSKGNGDAIKSTIPSTTRKDTDFHKKTTERWSSSPSHSSIEVEQRVQIAAKQTLGSAPGVTVMVLVITFSVVIIVLVPLLLLVLFRLHRKKSRKLATCQNEDKCRCDIALNDVDSCMCNNDVEESTIASLRYDADDSHLLGV